MNDKRIAFYGIRYDINYNSLLRELKREFPNRSEMVAEAKRRFWVNYMSDPSWLAEAVMWRSVAYFGLLPPGVFAEGGPRETKWTPYSLAVYVYSSLPGLLALTAFVAFLIRPSRPTFILSVALIGNWAVVFFAGFGDPRILYPVLPVHVILGACMIGPFSEVSNPSMPQRKSTGHYGKFLLVTCGILVAIGILRLLIGKPYSYRPLMGGAEISRKVMPQALTEKPLTLRGKWNKEAGWTGSGLVPGARVHGIIKVSNNMFPPKYAYELVNPAIPIYALDRDGELFYMAHHAEGGLLGLTYAGANVGADIREGDHVELYGTVLEVRTFQGWNYLWVRADWVRPFGPHNDIEG